MRYWVRSRFWKGKTLPRAMRHKIAATKTGVPVHTPESRAAIAAACRKRWANKKFRRRVQKALLISANSPAVLAKLRKPCTEARKKKLSETMRKQYAAGLRKAAGHNYTGILYKGARFRSTWEAAFALFLDSNRIKWVHEPTFFRLKDTTYTPDFYLPAFKLYVEIKGRLGGPRYINKAEELTRLYPEIKICVLRKEGLKELGCFEIWKETSNYRGA